MGNSPGKLQPYLASRADVLPFYAPCPFVTEVDRPLQTQQLVVAPLLAFTSKEVVPVYLQGENHLFYAKHLPWDTRFFGRPVFRLFQVLYAHQQFELLRNAIIKFAEQFFTQPSQYAFVQVPAEDIQLLAALSAAGWRMIETRLLYYRRVENLTHERFRVREGSVTDAPVVSRVAARTRNPYDRFHAEPAFSTEVADAFLARYAAETVNGLCDVVLLPDEPGASSDAFMALKLATEEGRQLGVPVAKVVLTAVAPECKGWHHKLLSESLYRAAAADSQYLYLTTQSTNRAVIRSCEKLQFRYGGATHVLSYRA